MPVYEYACGSCGGRFEIARKFSDPAISECNLCHSANVRKVLSTPAFVLKGSGWYVTDYASGDRKEGIEAEKPKPDPKPDPKPNTGCAAGACGGGTCPAKG